MKTALKKISLILIALFISFTNAHCQEENLDDKAGTTPLYNPNIREAKNLLFSFITRFQTLQLLQANEFVSKHITQHSLPFSDLYFALTDKLTELTEKESASDQIDLSEMQQLKDYLLDLPIATTTEQLKENLSKIFERSNAQYQNTLDQESLDTYLDYEEHRLSILIEYVNMFSGNEKLLIELYDYHLLNYNAFCEEHKGSLTRIENLANQGFIIEDKDSENETKEIETLSELTNDLIFKFLLLLEEECFQLNLDCKNYLSQFFTKLMTLEAFDFEEKSDPNIETNKDTNSPSAHEESTTPGISSEESNSEESDSNIENNKETNTPPAFDESTTPEKSKTTTKPKKHHKKNEKSHKQTSKQQHAWKKVKKNVKRFIKDIEGFFK